MGIPRRQHTRECWQSHTEGVAAGADIVQVDEPCMQARPEKARMYALSALSRAVEGINQTKGF